MRKWFCFLLVAVLLSTVCVGAEDVLVAQAQLDGTESEDSGQDLRDCSGLAWDTHTASWAIREPPPCHPDPSAASGGICGLCRAQSSGGSTNAVRCSLSSDETVSGEVMAPDRDRRSLRSLRSDRDDRKERGVESYTFVSLRGHPKKITLSDSPLSAAIDGAVGMVVLPVEPEVFEHVDCTQALARPWTRYGAAIEIPFAERIGIDQLP